jgi:hypothetical protein
MGDRGREDGGQARERLTYERLVAPLGRVDPLGEGSTMTEWTCDLMVPTAEIDDTVDTQDALRAALPSADSWPYQDLDAEALIEDIRLDLVDWFA